MKLRVSQQTKQALKLLVSQHRYTGTGNTYDSTIFTDMSETGHTVAVKDFSVVDKEEDWHKRVVEEAIGEHIKEPFLHHRGFCI